jgi:hypothetical protein
MQCDQEILKTKLLLEVCGFAQGSIETRLRKRLGNILALKG